MHTHSLVFDSADKTEKDSNFNEFFLMVIAVGSKGEGGMGSRGMEAAKRVWVEENEKKC